MPEYEMGSRRTSCVTIVSQVTDYMYCYPSTDLKVTDLER